MSFFNFRKQKNKTLKFEVFLDNLVEACLYYARVYDTDRIIKEIPDADKQELLARCTHKRGEDFFVKRKELYQKIFKDTFTRNGSVIPPVPHKSQKHRFIIAGSYFAGKRDLFTALMSNNSAVPHDVKKMFNRIPNKESTVVIDLRRIRGYIEEYSEALKEGYPYAGVMVRGEMNAICETLLNAAKMLNYNIIDYSKSYTKDISDVDIDVMKGVQRADEDNDQYKLHCVAVTAEPKVALSEPNDDLGVTDSNVVFNKTSRSIKGLSSPNAFLKLMRNSANAMVVWDKGRNQDDRFSVIAQSKDGELQQDKLNRSKWMKFKSFENFSAKDGQILESSLQR